MPLETATYLTDLVVANPGHSDGLSQADSHLRLLKSTLKTTFPNFTSAALASTQAQLDAAVAASSGSAPTRFPLGTALLPGLTPVGDTNTGLWSPAADQLAFSLGGTQVILMGSTSLVSTLGIGAPAFACTGAYSGGTGQLVPIGGTMIWWDDVLPTEGGYAWANGQIIANANTVCPVLLARWGTRFGGNGVTTMGVPDLRDTVPVGKSTMGAVASRALQTLTNTVIGSLIGLANNVLLAANLPPITSSGSNTISMTPSGFNIPKASSSIGQQPSPSTGGNSVPTTPGTWSPLGAGELQGTNTITVNSTGTTSTAVNNVQPSTTCNYIIRLG